MHAFVFDFYVFLYPHKTHICIQSDTCLLFFVLYRTKNKFDFNEERLE